eukprot:523440_1
MLSLQFAILHYLMQCINTEGFEWFELFIPKAIEHSAVSIHNDTIYLINGRVSASSNMTSVFMTLADFNHSWREISNIDMPFGASQIWYPGQTHLQIGNIMYGVSCWQWHLGTTLFSYDVSLNQYLNPATYNAELLQQAANSCVTSTNFDGNDTIYIIGGGGNGFLDTLQIYNIEYDKWRYGASLNTARMHNGCASVHGLHATGALYTFGGKYGSRVDQYLDSIEKYIIMNNTWIVLEATLRYEMYGTSCIFVEWNHVIYCIGGYARYSEYVRDIELFDVHTETILAHDPTLDLHRGRTDPSLLITEDNYLLVVSGDTEESILDIERLNLSDYITTTPYYTTEDVLETTQFSLTPSDFCTRRNTLWNMDFYANESTSSNDLNWTIWSHNISDNATDPNDIFRLFKNWFSSRYGLPNLPTLKLAIYDINLNASLSTSISTAKMYDISIILDLYSWITHVSSFITLQYKCVGMDSYTMLANYSYSEIDYSYIRHLSQTFAFPSICDDSTLTIGLTLHNESRFYVQNMKIFGFHCKQPIETTSEPFYSTQSGLDNHSVISDGLLQIFLFILSYLLGFMGIIWCNNRDSDNKQNSESASIDIFSCELIILYLQIILFLMDTTTDLLSGYAIITTESCTDDECYIDNDVAIYGYLVIGFGFIGMVIVFWISCLTIQQIKNGENTCWLDEDEDGDDDDDDEHGYFDNPREVSCIQMLDWFNIWFLDIGVFVVYYFYQNSMKRHDIIGVRYRAPDDVLISLWISLVDLTLMVVCKGFVSLARCRQDFCCGICVAGVGYALVLLLLTSEWGTPAP